MGGSMVNERMFFVVIIRKIMLTIQNSRQLPCRFSLVTFPFIKKKHNVQWFNGCAWVGLEGETTMEEKKR